MKLRRSSRDISLSTPSENKTTTVSADSNGMLIGANDAASNGSLVVIRSEDAENSDIVTAFGSSTLIGAVPIATVTLQTSHCA